MILLVFQNWKGKIDFPLFCCFQPSEAEEFASAATLTHIPCTYGPAAVGDPSHLVTTVCCASISALHAGAALGQPFPFYPGKCFNAIQCFLVMRLQTPSYHVVEDRDTVKGKLSGPASHHSLLFLLQALAALENQCADTWQQAGAICSCDWWIFYSQSVLLYRHDE